ncbi:MAG: hypothetical protein VX893_17560 [Candidatus Latescibacterota bacterium]|nr:hypothetical protein [Candidatus Latescibacterota bacterium]
MQLSLSTGTQFESHQPQVHQTKTVKSISPTRRQPQKKAEGSPGEHRLELCNLEKEQTGEDRPAGDLQDATFCLREGQVA